MHALNNAPMAVFGIFVCPTVKEDILHQQETAFHTSSSPSSQCLPFEFLCLSQGIRPPISHMLNLR